MIKFLTTVLLVISCFSIPCFAEAVKTNDIEILEQYMNQADKNTLVIFDVDDVLLVPKDQILQAHNKEDQLLLRKKLEKSVDKSEAEKLFSIIFEERKNGVVDPKMPQLITELQSRGIKALGLTNCFTGKFGNITAVETWRTDELEKNGYHFVKSWKSIKQKSFMYMALNTQESPPLFTRGVIFASSAPKGDALEAFLKYAKFMPTKIIFIDNKTKHLESVKKFAQIHNIPFIGIEYTVVADSKAKPLNKKRAEFQFEILQKERKWISDEEAERMMLKEINPK